MTNDVLKQSVQLLNKVINDALKDFNAFLERLKKNNIDRSRLITLLDNEYEVCKRKSDNYINNAYPLDENDTKIDVNGVDYISINSAMRLSLYAHADNREIEFIKLKNDFIHSLEK